MTENNMKIDSNFTIPDSAAQTQRGPEWLVKKRTSSRDNFNNTDIPQRGLHLWRYTDPKKFMFDVSNATETQFGDNFEVVQKTGLEQLEQDRLAVLVTDLGGREIKFHGLDKLSKTGLIACTLSEAVENHSDLAQKYLYELINGSTGKFEAMNGALWNDGIFLYIPDNVTIEKPIHLIREAGGENSASFPRLLVVVGKNSEVTIIDEYGGGSLDPEKGKSYCDTAVEIFGLADSRTRYVSLQRQSSGMNSYLTHRVKLENSATMLTIPLAFGGALSKQNFGVELAGQGAQSKMYGLLFGGERQHFDNHTLHHHSAGQTYSDIDFKVVLKDRALSAYTGLIRIDNKAKTCEAYQENRNLLLNKGTVAETIPELEILNEDVMCSHGATIGPIDEQSIFYLNSRGINRPDAVRMIVAGFVQSTLKMLPEDIRDRIMSFVEQRLETI